MNTRKIISTNVLNVGTKILYFKTLFYAVEFFTPCIS